MTPEAYLWTALASHEPCRHYYKISSARLGLYVSWSGAQWEQWGNPNDPEYYDYVKSYSPIDNIRRAAYPNILLTGGSPHHKGPEGRVCTFMCHIIMSA